VPNNLQVDGQATANGGLKTDTIDPRTGSSVTATVTRSLNSNRADSAAQADLANNALNAIRANSAALADRATNADHADRATLADTVAGGGGGGGGGNPGFTFTVEGSCPAGAQTYSQGMGPNGIVSTCGYASGGGCTPAQVGAGTCGM